MKNFSLSSIILIIGLLSSCQMQQPSVDAAEYPDALQKVFEKHGGIATWNEMRALQYRKNETEQQFIDLKNRRDKVVGEDYEYGFDGTNIWLKADTSFKGDPAFMHNLYFYFYAMPFVLGDDGIVYKDAAPLQVDSTTYPGILIQYKDGVGQVSTDEYIIHYHPDTYQMAWLGYTVTFSSKEKSNNFKWIKYDDWTTVDGLLLPQSFKWYARDAEGQFGNEPRYEATFQDIKINKKPFDDATFEATEGAKIVETIVSK